MSFNSDDEIDENAEWKVILRSKEKDQLVMYNGQEVVVKHPRKIEDAPALSSAKAYATTNPACCPTCNRPLSNEQAFMDSKYFQFLEQILSKNTAVNDASVSDNVRNFGPSYSTRLHKDCFNQGYYGKFFLEQKLLGRGYRGSVFLCKHHLDNISLGLYAVKKVPGGDDVDWLHRTLKEVKSLERLHHPNIVLYRHAWLEIHQSTRFGPAIPCLFILMEYADRGNLEDYVSDGFFKSSEIIPLFTDLLNGLCYLHDMGIIHRDLKPQNLLLYGRDRM